MRIERRSWSGEDAPGLAAELRSEGAAAEDLAADVERTLERVRSEGDAALLELSERFDGIAPERIRVDGERLEAARGTLDPELRTALERAAANVRAVAEGQLAGGPVVVEPPEGQRITVREVAVASAGIYAPGGRAAYPSSVLMGVIPAIAAGVERVVVASPPGPGGSPPASVLAAAAIAGADDVYAIGGAQAIAALAYGTETVEPVDVIAGPGGPHVQEAKLRVSHRVGIDGYAGPSELVVVCDEAAPASWLALDLCAQAEHGADGLLVAISPSPEALAALAAAVEDTAEGANLGDASLFLVEAPDLEGAVALAERIAPEHLQLCCAGAERLATGIRRAGCVFAGVLGATAFGDYAAGSNHVLPTGGAGRFSGPLGPGTFRRKIATVEMSGPAAVELAPVVATISGAEGFPLHGESATARSERTGGD